MAARGKGGLPLLALKPPTDHGTDVSARLDAEGPSATAALALGRSCRAFLVRTASALNSLPEPGGLGAAAKAASRARRATLATRRVATKPSLSRRDSCAPLSVG
ncbi:hypothetical protein RI054_18g83810 [Pseudoscourfieldia marina]